MLAEDLDAWTAVRLLALLRGRLAGKPEMVASPTFQRRVMRNVFDELRRGAARLRTVASPETRVDPRTEGHEGLERWRGRRAALIAQVGVLLASLDPPLSAAQRTVMRDWLRLGSFEAVAALRGRTGDAVRKLWDRLAARLAEEACARGWS